MGLCQACGQNEAVFHVTLNVQITGPASTRNKLVQVILCDHCDVCLQQVFCKDDYLKERIAKRLTEEPQYKSQSPIAWHAQPRPYQPVTNAELETRQSINKTVELVAFFERNSR